MKITELNKINLEPGDILVVKMKPTIGFASKEHGKSFDKMLQELFPNNKVIIARPDDKFEVIKQKALE